MKKIMKGQRCPVTNTLAPNTVSETVDNCHISFNASTRDYGCATTAIVIAGTLFFVLKGDHTDSLLDSDGIETYIRYFIANLGLAHPYGEHRVAAGFDGDTFGLRVVAQTNIPEKVLRELEIAISSTEENR